MNYQRELDFARRVCAEIGTIQRSSEASVQAKRKGDGSPVTEVDLRCEHQILERVAEAFPHDGLLGEETGDHAGSSGRRWIVDPLDGTRPYVRGIPTYSVLLALEDDMAPVVGVIHMAALGVACWAMKGAGAYLNGEPIRVSTTSQLSRAMGSALGFVERSDTPIGARLLQFMRRWDYAYGFMDAYSYVCVASGRLDLCINLLDKAWDCAAAACIVTEAGGRFSDVNGAASVHSGSIVLTNGALHDSVLDALACRQAQ